MAGIAVGGFDGIGDEELDAMRRHLVMLSRDLTEADVDGLAGDALHERLSRAVLSTIGERAAGIVGAPAMECTQQTPDAPDIEA